MALGSGGCDRAVNRKARIDAASDMSARINPAYKGKAKGIGGR